MGNVTAGIVGGGLIIFGFNTGVLPHEAACAVTFAGGAILTMKEANKQHFIVLSVLSIITAFLASGLVRDYWELQEPASLLGSCFLGFATPFLLRELGKSAPKIAKSVTAGIQSWITAWFEKKK
jgi:hypothetical protein